MRLSEVERLAALETQVANLKDYIREADERRRDEMAEMKKQLEQLLSLKSQGQGAFWLATTIFGTSFALFISYVVSWFK